MISYTLRFVLLTLIIGSTAICQDNTDTSASKKKIVTIVPGAEYEAGWLHRLFFGDHWRSLWTTPIDVEVLDLGRFAGGLTPLKRGGGFQTKSLTFKGNDGKEYKFRSINKDPKKVLTKELQESIAADIIQDQISSSNPFSAIIVAPILNAVGVLQAVPQLCVLPDDEKLGEFRKDFGGLFGTLEISPGAEDFEGSTKVISSVKLFKRLEKRYDEHVDSREFLKARLMDIFFGDWDRHKDQWKWARFEIGGQKFYKPIPNDRDQAFAEFDGVFPKIAESAVLQLNHFGSKYPAMQFMTWSGRFLDRKFLSFLEKGDWDTVTNFVFDKLTDSLIDYSVSRLPPAIYEKAKDELLTKLKSRRDLIKEASLEYYELVNRYIDVYCTSKSEFVEVIRMDSRTEVSVYRRDKKSGEKIGGPLRHKIFDNSLTCEIRVYLGGNDDKAVVSGQVTEGPIVRIIGGSGKDELVDSSVVRGELLGFIPLTATKSRTYFYDDGKKTVLTLGQETIYNNEKVKEPEDSLKKYYNRVKKTLSKDEKEKFEERIDNFKYEPQQIDRGYLWRSMPLIGYTPDIGIIFGGGPILYKYGFRFSPYQYRMHLLAAYAPKKRGLSGLFLDYKGTFYGLKKNIRAELHLRKSGIEVNNYFGPGNETAFKNTLYNAGFYKIEHEEYLIKPAFDFYAYKNLLANVSIFLKYFVLKTNDNIVRSINPPGTEKVTYLGFNTGLTLDNRNHQSAPDSGYYADVQGYLYPRIFNNLHSFGKVKVDLRFYYPYKYYTKLSIALRVKAEKVWGTYPFYESAFIGGISSVRGLPSERYSGNASFAGGAELRVKAMDVFLLFPEEIGVLAFIESGRVFLSGEKSGRWHTGFGGGFYCSIINKDITFSLTLGRSEKRFGFYFNSGFTF